MGQRGEIANWGDRKNGVTRKREGILPLGGGGPFVRKDKWWRGGAYCTQGCVYSPNFSRRDAKPQRLNKEKEKRKMISHKGTKITKDDMCVLCGKNNW